VISPRQTRAKAEAAGRWGEQIAALFLQFKGYVILERRVKTGGGEIDLIARRGKTLTFVEVKLRQKPVDPAILLAPQQLRRILDAAAIWTAKRAWTGGLVWRYDLIVVRPWTWPLHIKDAWRPSHDPALETGRKSGNVVGMFQRRK
jgi:putative endonuclease